MILGAVDSPARSNQGIWVKYVGLKYIKYNQYSQLSINHEYHVEIWLMLYKITRYDY